MNPIRKEVHTRSQFALKEAERYVKQANQSGNVLTSKATRKILQARNIYVHYVNEFARHFDMPMTD